MAYGRRTVKSGKVPILKKGSDEFPGITVLPGRLSAGDPIGNWNPGSGGAGQQRIEVFEAETRPGFIAIEVFDGLSKRNEFRTYNPATPASDTFIADT